MKKVNFLLKDVYEPNFPFIASKNPIKTGMCLKTKRALIYLVISIILFIGYILILILWISLLLYYLKVTRTRNIVAIFFSRIPYSISLENSQKLAQKKLKDQISGEKYLNKVLMSYIIYLSYIKKTAVVTSLLSSCRCGGCGECLNGGLGRCGGRSARGRSSGRSFLVNPHSLQVPLVMSPEQNENIYKNEK